MGIAPINLARVSQNLRAFNLLETVRATQADLFRVQNQLATGLRFVAPSDDVVRSAAAGSLDRRLDALRQVEGHLRTANSTLQAGESAMQDAINLFLQAREITSEAAGDTLSADERKALAVVTDTLIEQALAVGNRRHLEKYLFSGHRADEPPFELTGDGVLFRGDGGQNHAIVEPDASQDAFTISGMEFFNAVSGEVRGFVDLDPALTRDTRISDLRGTTGSGVRLGRVAISDGRTQVEIDLSGAATVGDLVDQLNAELPFGVRARLTSRALVLESVPPAALTPFTVGDVGGGQTARDLGIRIDTPVLRLIGADLDPALTLRTGLNDLNAGTGLNLAGGLTIRNGSRSATLAFTDADTIEDVINQINQSGVGVWARIAEDGATIQVSSRISGASLRIEENGGQAATALGIRSLYAGTPLASLNEGRGIHTVEGNDLRLTTADGTTIDIDLDDIDLRTGTLQDVINLFNTRGGGAITAALTAQGNGIVIADDTVGGGSLRIERLHVSPAIDGLGLAVSATGNELVGTDVNPVRADGPFTALLDLRTALLNDDRQAITAAGERLESALQHAQEVQGRMASLARSMEERAVRIESDVTAAQVLRSDVRDVDITEAVVRFQQLQTALQANLATASRVLNLSLLDALR